MSPWVGEDGCVQSFYRPYGKIYTSRKSPKGLGSEAHLYTAGWPGFSDPYFFEKGLGKIENSAAKIRNRLITEGPDHLTADERETFAFAISLLLIRRPEDIHLRVEQASGNWEKSVNWLVEEQEKISPLNEQQSDFFESLRKHSKDLVLEAMLQAGMRRAQSWSPLLWRVLDVSNAGIELVLGDRPIECWGRDGVLACLQIPLSPAKFFVAGSLPSWQEIKFKPEYSQGLAEDIIEGQFRAAARFVIAKDLGKNNGYFTLAERYLAR